MNKCWKVTAILSMVLISSFVQIGIAAETPKLTSEKKILATLSKGKGTVFPIGTYNERNKNNFTGESYVARLGGQNGINIANVTFVNGAHTYWHIHEGTCQILMPVAGKGYYQIWGQEPKVLKLGETVTIPDGIKHWHGAANGQTFQHVAVSGPAKYKNIWLEPVDEQVFKTLK